MISSGNVFTDASELFLRFDSGLRRISRGVLRSASSNVAKRSGRQESTKSCIKLRKRKILDELLLRNRLRTGKDEKFTPKSGRVIFVSFLRKPGSDWFEVEIRACVFGQFGTFGPSGSYFLE